MASNKTKTDKAKASMAAEAQGTSAKEAAKGSARKTGKESSASKKDVKKNGKPGFFARVKNYFKNVRGEIKRVVWPTKPDMIKYTGAVLGMLVFFGILIAVVDALIVPVLYAFSGLR